MIIITGILHFFAVMWADEGSAWRWMVSWLLTRTPVPAWAITCPLTALVIWRALNRRSRRP